jgi:endonuclease/exonuclease/phosphatase family metal-dependent hydrolase
MKRGIKIFLLFIFPYCLNPLFASDREMVGLGAHLCDDGTTMRVSSYNIRYDAAADHASGNAWSLRMEPLAALIRHNRFDIIGTQEGNFKQMAELKALLPEYDYVAYPYGGSNADNHTAAIVYRKDKYEVLDQGVFWLSETPYEQSIGWDATDTRICAWAKMRDKLTGKSFYFFNAHFYWRYTTAKANSGPLVVRMIQEIVNENIPVICTGDYNSNPSTPQIQSIKGFLSDARDVAVHAPFGSEDTNLGGGNFQGEAKGRIDYIFVNDRIQVLNYVVLSDTYANGKHPSDHLPVVCDVVLR